jgi:Tfp pilus assembly protein PilX
MIPLAKSAHLRHKGVVLIVAMIFVLIFSALAVSMATMSGANVQLASNHHKVNSALSAAESGLECGRYIIAKTLPFLDSTAYNTVTEAQANVVWSRLCAQVQAQPWVSDQAQQTTTEIITPTAYYGATNGSFQVRFYRAGTYSIRLEGIGNDGQVTRRVSVETTIQKDNDVLNYAAASRGRIWLTGQSTIHGDVYSAWDRAEISPYNMTNDSSVLGTINTVLSLEQIQAQSYQLETLDTDGNPIDANGDPLGNNYEDRYYGPDDEIQAYHEGINYDQPYQDVPGMDIADYDTDGYNFGLTEIPSCPPEAIEIEYFPHASGNYNYPRDGTPGHTSNPKFNRNVYENQTFTNAKLPDNRNALFRNCTFEEVLYIDCSKSGSTYYNNVRFENCAFNGVIVTDVPETFKWMYNCLYFTGEATFNNTSSTQEATILAPHFNVNLGNTNPEQSENNVLTGAIIGGIVDVRGNAQIYGTIISMCDTTQWPSGYVTNIGATLDDGGSETTELGDVGVIDITPDEDQMLPNGIMSPIVIKPFQNTYSEGA